MPADRSKCIRCGGRSEPGYLLDRGHMNQSSITTWIEGAPQYGWFGLKVSGRPQAPCSAWRCEDCGHVELFVD